MSTLVRQLSIADTVLLMAKRRHSVETAIWVGGALVGLGVTLVVVVIFGIELDAELDAPYLKPSNLFANLNNRNLVLICGAIAGAVLGGWIYKELTEEDES